MIRVCKSTLTCFFLFKKPKNKYEAAVLSVLCVSDALGSATNWGKCAFPSLCFEKVASACPERSRRTAAVHHLHSHRKREKLCGIFCRWFGKNLLATLLQNIVAQVQTPRNTSNMCTYNRWILAVAGGWGDGVGHRGENTEQQQQLVSWRALSVNPSLPRMNGSFRTKHDWPGVCVHVCAWVCFCVGLLSQRFERGTWYSLIVYFYLLGCSYCALFSVLCMHESERESERERGSERESAHVCISRQKEETNCTEVQCCLLKKGSFKIRDILVLDTHARLSAHTHTRLINRNLAEFLKWWQFYCSSAPTSIVWKCLYAPLSRTSVPFQITANCPMGTTWWFSIP